MFLRDLKLVNFRNILPTQLHLTEVTVLTGKNAQGKSNLLESIYFLATTKSHRADKDSQLIKYGEGYVRVEGAVEDGFKTEGHLNDQDSSQNNVTKLEIAMQFRDGTDGDFLDKRVKVNGIARRSTDYLGNLVVVAFSPEDINLVSGAPSLRRWYIDISLAQIDKNYKTAMNSYTAALITRNKLLKKIRENLAKTNELVFWTDQMVKFGQIITDKRTTFFKAINEKSDGSFGKYTFKYLPSLISDERIGQYLSREVAAGVSLIGPHRDDFTFELAGYNLAYFGSRGEQRTSVLELKLAELKFIKDVKDVTPILLLDDVFSELDQQHQEFVASEVTKQQTIMTAVETENLPSIFLHSVKVIDVRDGKLSDSKD